jgi:hypothetical protein
MYTPPAEITSGCIPGKPKCPFPAEKTTIIPCLTALAIAASSGRKYAGSGGSSWVLLSSITRSIPQLQDIISGPRETAVLKSAVEFTGLILTIVNSTSGPIAKMLADSPVPCPDSS